MKERITKGVVHAPGNTWNGRQPSVERILQMEELRSSLKRLEEKKKDVQN